MAILSYGEGIATSMMGTAVLHQPQLRCRMKKAQQHGTEGVGNLKGRGEGLLVQHEGDQSSSTHMALQHKVAPVIQYNCCHCCWQKGIGAGITSIRNGLLPLQTTSPD